MAWFKVDDGLHASRKFLSIPRRSRFAAVGVWTIAGSWSADQLTNGHVPQYMLTEWGVPPSAAESLVSAGLWEVERDGYAFRNWLEYQPSKQDVDAERAASRERMRELRAKRKQPKPQNDAAESDVFGRTGANGSENVRNPDPTRPDPTRPDPPSSSNKELGEGSHSALSPFCMRHPIGTDSPCRACKKAAAEFDAAQPKITPSRPKYGANTDPMCKTHPGYPIPCIRCAEEMET